VKRIEDREFKFHVCNEQFLLVDMVLHPSKWAKSTPGDIMEIPVRNNQRWNRDGTLSAFQIDNDLFEAAMPRAYTVWLYLKSEYVMYLGMSTADRKRGFKAYISRWMNPGAGVFDDVRKILVKESFTYLSAKTLALDLLARVEPLM
jgi:hypothetical protein